MILSTLKRLRETLHIPRKFRILVMPEGSSSMKQFSFRLKHLTFGALGGSVFIMMVVYLTAYFLGTYVAERKISGVMQEQYALKNQVSSLGDKLTSLKDKLADLSHSDNLLRQGLGLPNLSNDTREAGVGGVAPVDHKGTDADSLADEVAELEREISLQKQSFSEIQTGLKHQNDVVAHTPSIRPIHDGFIGSGFGRRHDPFTGQLKEHEGLDFNAPMGTPIFATAPGIVRIAKFLTQYGNVIVIDHLYGYQTVYGHCSGFAVRVGETVKRGDIIGYVGMTGRATGPHVHYEVRMHTRPVDPMDFLFDTYAEQKH